MVDLQQQKETAREELRQAKKEIQTEKLKGAATVAAANIAESVGSLFGSNKVKTLERENTALHREEMCIRDRAKRKNDGIRVGCFGRQAQQPLEKMCIRDRFTDSILSPKTRLPKTQRYETDSRLRFPVPAYRTVIVQFNSY